MLRLRGRRQSERHRYMTDSVSELPWETARLAEASPVGPGTSAYFERDTIRFRDSESPRLHKPVARRHVLAKPERD